MINEYSGSKFLSKKYADLHNDEPVQNAAVRLAREKNVHPDSFSKEEKIDAYLHRLERLFLDPGEETRTRNINTIIEPVLESIVISAEDFPDKYLENEQRLAREEGHGAIAITPEIRAEAIKLVQSDQEDSFLQWVEYLSSSDAPYPTWFKYFVLRSISKLQPYDKVNKCFPKRSRTTTKIFPEINQEALAFVYESIINQIPSEKAAATKHLESMNFSKLYAEAVQNQQAENAKAKEKRDSIDGRWIKYNQGSDAKPLAQSLQGMGTGWCTAAKSMAEKQLQAGDFYVFYTKDNKNKYRIPRIAIRMENGEVAEVRGINPDQELEPELIDKAREKFSPLAGGEKYEKRVTDMKFLTTIEKKVSEGLKLSRIELDFLYEVHEKIEGFGQKRDPRINEIIQIRTNQRGLPSIGSNTLAYQTELVDLKIETGEKLTAEEQELAEKMANERIISGIERKSETNEELTDSEAQLLYLNPGEINRIHDFGAGRNLFWLIKKRWHQRGLPILIRDTGYHFEKILHKLSSKEHFTRDELSVIYEEYHYLQSEAYWHEIQNSQPDDYERDYNFTNLVRSLTEPRNRLTDLAFVHGIREDQIVDHESLITKDTVVFDGDLKIKGFDETLPRSLQYVYGTLDISESHIHDLGNLRQVTGNLIISTEKNVGAGKIENRINTEITSLKNLEKVLGNIDADGSELRDLGQLSFVGGYLSIRKTGIYVPKNSHLDIGGGTFQD